MKELEESDVSKSEAVKRPAIYVRIVLTAPSKNIHRYIRETFGRTYCRTDWYDSTKSKNDADKLNDKRRALNENCTKGQQEITKLTAESRERALKHIHEQFDRIKFIESETQGVEEDRKDQIRQNVAESIEQFKFEGNGRQHEFNTARINELSRATDFQERGSVGAAVKALEQAEAALKERNKLLRIADKYGWDVVEEFMDDPLTESTEEATRLKQAEYRAKMKRRDKYVKADRPNPYYKNPVEKKDLNSFENPCLRNLADKLPRIVMSSKSKNTIKVYDYAFKFF
ncbi:unnamed protein product [Mytilus edulis]|uniref:Uncharacterized protein n=1 Tax=Mytilus edulis TaxID=6550 RepID=A0A8S3PMH4_MYTED|nr:unnamed protein product [Mytilus edulis]